MNRLKATLLALLLSLCFAAPAGAIDYSVYQNPKMARAVLTQSVVGGTDFAEDDFVAYATGFGLFLAQAWPDHFEKDFRETQGKKMLAIVFGGGDHNQSLVDGSKDAETFSKQFDVSTHEAQAVIKFLTFKLDPNSHAPTATPLAIVDPATVGEWELPVNSSRWILRIEPNGAYAFHTDPMDAAKPDSGVFSSEAGRWTLRANSGFTDGGEYSIVPPDTFITKGRLGTGFWRRVASAPKPFLGKIDQRTVGDWELPVGSGRWVWRIKSDGSFEFHSEANDGMKPGEGSFSSMDGRWSLRSPDGYTDGGPYSFPTPDTFLATGHLGTGAWRRIL